MALTFFIFIIISVFHFIYESIFLPNKRLELRYDLFKIRDQLRQIKAQKKLEVSDKVFENLDNSICSTIQHLPYFKLSLLFEAEKRFERDDKMRSKVQKKIKIIEDCNVEEVRLIHERLSTISMRAIVLNAGGWVYIVLPIIAVTYIIEGLGRFRKKLKHISENLVFISNNDFSSLVDEAYA